MATFSQISVSGYRAFAEAQTLDPGQPVADKPGSGLTVLVGPNNGGKSSFLEAAYLATQGQSISLGKNERNKKSHYLTRIVVSYSDGKVRELKNTLQNLEQLSSHGKVEEPHRYSVYFVHRHREFPRQFEATAADRSAYLQNHPFQNSRDYNPGVFGRRARSWAEPEWTRAFSELTGHSLAIHLEGNRPDIELDGQEHDPKLMGAGISQIACILDAVRDAQPGSVVMIDEPEAALHPGLQRRLMSRLLKLTENVQVIVATHSPYFVSWDSLRNGGTIARIVRSVGEYSRVYPLSGPTARLVSGLANDLNNPHVLGHQASEIFFQSDKVILVEGQEDVICYRKVLEDLGVKVEGDFFGWGVGGASKMRVVARLLKDLGFTRVVGLLDRGKEADRKQLAEEFSEFRFHCIPAEDVRDKPSRQAREPISGLCSTSGAIKDEHRHLVKSIFEDIRDWFKT